MTQLAHTQQTIWNTPKAVVTVHALRNAGIQIPDEIPGHTLVEVPSLQVSALRTAPPVLARTTPPSDELTTEAVRQRILERITHRPVDHTELWRMCGSPQGKASWYFDVELKKLIDEGLIYRENIGAGNKFSARGVIA